MRSVPRVAVRLDVPPHRASLIQWGRTDDGQWWALVTWHEVVQGAGGVGRDSLTMSAWTQARHVRPTHPDRPQPEVPRIRLGGDPSRWAGPDGRTGYWRDQGWHVDPLDGRDPLPAHFQRPQGGSAYS